MPGSEQDALHTQAPPVGRHGITLHQNCPGVPMKIWRIVAEVLGRKLAHRASTNVTADLTPASLRFGRELQLPCDRLFGELPEKEVLILNHEANSMAHLHGIHNYVGQHLKLASDRMKPRYDRVANCGSY
jgi:hypothetical protein